MKALAVMLVVLVGACSPSPRDAETPRNAAAGESATAPPAPAVPNQPRADTRLRDSAEAGPVIEIPTIADTARTPPGS